MVVAVGQNFGMSLFGSNTMVWIPVDLLSFSSFVSFFRLDGIWYGVLGVLFMLYEFSHLCSYVISTFTGEAFGFSVTFFLLDSQQSV